MEELRKLQSEDIPKDIGAKLEAFVETMREENIFGNEAIQTLNLFYYSGFFGEDSEKVYLGRKEMQNGKKTLEQM